MNKVILLILMLGGLGASAQYTVPKCYGDTSKSIISIESAYLFNNAGINLNSYNWSNPMLNCHINSSLKEWKQYKSSFQMGTYGLIIGSAFLYTAYALTDADGAPLIWAIGITGTVGGGFLLARGFKKKKSFDTRMNIVGDYYRQNNL